MKLLFLSCLLVVLESTKVIRCQEPRPCETPKQWEAKYFEFDSIKGEQTRAHITYDAIYRRERVVEEYLHGKDKDYFDVLYLHSTRLMYVYNFKTKKCTIEQINRPWRNFGIPRNASSLGEAYIGASGVPKAHLLVTFWRDEIKDEKGNKYEYSGVWTHDACLPVTVALSSTTAKVNAVMNFFDIVSGISNPDVFIPRKECRENSP
jgi:hypothetical protein